MQLPTKVVLTTLVTVVFSIATMPAKAQNPGCHFIGNSACGGSQNNKCAPHERYYSQQCANGQVVNSCIIDNYCGSVNKGRVNIDGSWRAGGYHIAQNGDSLYITGGAAGPASGQFTSGQTISVTWPQAKKTFVGTVVFNPATNVGVKIQWNDSPSNYWTR